MQYFINSYKKIFIYGTFLIGFLIIFFTWLSNIYSLDVNSAANILRNISTISALLAVYFVLWQFILIARIPWLEKVFGFDKLSVLHHWGGIISYFCILSHGIFIILGLAIMRNISLWNQFSYFASKDDFLTAIISVFLFTFVVVLSISIVMRKLKYETWYYVHLAVYLAVILAGGHQMSAGHDFRQSALFSAFWIFIYTISVGSLVLFRFLRPIYYFYKHRFYVEKIVADTANSFSLYIKGNNIENFKIQSGQFMIFRFLAKGFWYEAHPFSLSVIPNTEYLRITFKLLGDFTKILPNIKIGTKVIIDGPNGAFTLKENEKKILMIAGGAGISPVFSLIEKALKLGREIVLVYSNRDENSIMLRQDIERLGNIYGNAFKVIHILSEDKNWKGESGRIDIDKMKRFVPDIIEREVYICGPKPMIESAESICRELGLKSNSIHFEKFSFM